MLYFVNAPLNVPVSVAYRIVLVSAKAMTKNEETELRIVVAKLPRLLNSAKNPTRISTMVEMRAMT